MTTQSQKSIKVDTTKFITLESKPNALKFQIYHNFNPYPYPHKIDTHFPYFLNSYANFVKTQNCSLLEFYRKSIVEKGYKHSDTVKCKNKISCITTSVILKEKTNRTKANIERYLPLYFLDIDPKNSIKEGLTHDFTKNIDLLKEKLKLCPYVKIMHKSVSNFGLVCVFQFPPDSTVAEHYGRCLAVNKYVIDFLKNDDVFTNNFEIDTTGTDIVRLRFLSYDTDLTFNPKAEIFSDKLDIVEVEKVKKEYDNLDNEKYNVADIIHIHCPNLRISNDKIIRIDDGSKAGTYNEKDNTVYFYTPNRIDGFEQKKLYNAFMVCRLFNIPFEQKKKKQNETKVFTVERYLSEKFEQIKHEALKYKNVIVTAPTGAGKTGFLAKYVKTIKTERTIIALPRINNITEQIVNFEGFAEIHTNGEKLQTQKKIMCCHASLYSILATIKENETVTVIVDEFQDLHKNIESCYEYERLLELLKKDNVTALYFSATVLDAFYNIYSKNVIKIEQKEKQKQVLNIVYRNPKAINKEHDKECFSSKFVAKNKKAGFFSTIFIESKERIERYKKMLEIQGYKVLTLDADTENKKEIVHTITSKEIGFFDVLLHTSSLKAGMNIIHDKVRMLQLDCFYSYDKRKYINLIDTIQLNGRMRQGIRDYTIYIDFNVYEGKKTVNYEDYYRNLHLANIENDLIDIEEKQSRTNVFTDSFIDIHNKKPFVSTKKILEQYEVLKNAYTTIQDLKNAFPDATITETNYTNEIAKDKSKMSFKKYKERVLDMLLNCKEEVLTAFVDAGYIAKDFIEHEETRNKNDVSITALVEGFKDFDKQTLELLHEYKYFLTYYDNEKTILILQNDSQTRINDFELFNEFFNDLEKVFTVMTDTKINRKLVENRIKSNERYKSIRNFDTTKINKHDIERYKKIHAFGIKLKKILEEKSLTKKEVLEKFYEAQIVFDKTKFTIENVLTNYLNIFYNVEYVYNSEVGCWFLRSLHEVNKNNEYYILKKSVSKLKNEGKTTDIKNVENLCFDYVEPLF